MLVKLSFKTTKTNKQTKNFLSGCRSVDCTIGLCIRRLAAFTGVGETL